MRRYLVILGALVLALAGVGVLAFYRSPTLGLDLQGGLQVVLQAKAPKGQQITSTEISNSIEIMRQRIDKLGVAEPVITKQGTNQIAIELAGVHNSARAAQIVGQTAQLEFYDLQADLTGPSISAQRQAVATDRLLALLSSQKARAAQVGVGQWYLYSAKKALLGGPADSKQQLLRDVGLKTAPAGSVFYGVPADRIVITCGIGAVVCPGVGAAPTRTFYYLFKYQPTEANKPIPEMTGKDINGGRTRQDFDPSSGGPVVAIQFTGKGGGKFHAITRTLAQRGQAETSQFGTGQPIFQNFAIVLDGEIRSFPYIDFRDNPDGIAGGRAQITGLDSITEAKNLALVLQTGALPLEFVQIDRSDVSATLGADSLRQAYFAAIVGLALVALFLLLFYRFLGVVAVIGLGIYGVLLYGAILVFGVTLTLPGFAGLILTIGVAADANVVIFERIKEEVRGGKSVRASIGTGYRKGFSTIVDANVVTMITAFVLFAVATGGVRGFALMLLIGTLISMLTAVAATRALLGVLAGFRWFDNSAFMGAAGQRIPAWQRVDFIGRKRSWFAMSGAILAIGIASLGWQGLNLGIDFKGGSQISFKTPQPVAIDKVRSEIASTAGASAVIQGRGKAVGGRYKQFQVRTESLTASKQDSLQQRLETQFQAKSVGVRNVSASFSRQIFRGAIVAIVVSLLLIVIYVSLRFEFKFAIPVLIALFHDVFIAVGVYSLAQREVTASTVAAILTILGYSIYDTIIIFDRIRENIPLMKKSSMAAIANQSLWETIRRSLATTFITLLPVTALLVFGGDTLKDFAFALLVGITSGAYSTIFIATPLLVLLKEREPEYAKRKDAGLREKLEALEPAEVEAAPAAEPEPEPEPAAAAKGDGASVAARREERRKRRRARPHGRAR